jgi:release factor glutamine methyltransferase
VTDAFIDGVSQAARRRAAGAPFAYAAGRAAFRHLTLAVDEHVLIPRQETELLVELVLTERRASPGGVAVDIGTGSGAIALALATEGRFDRVIATDLAVDALAVARRNATALLPAQAARLEFRSGDLLAPLAGESVDVLVSNPPYIAWEEAADLPAAVRDWEPGHALLCGDRGLAITRRLVAGAPVLLSSGGLLALEVDSRRATAVAGLIAGQDAWTEVAVHQDLTGRDRFVLATRR